MTVNEEIRDRLIEHSVYVNRLTNYEVRRVAGVLKEMEDGIRSALLQADITDWSEQRYRTLLGEVKGVQRVYNPRVYERLIQDLQEFASTEAAVAGRIIGQSAGPFLELASVTLSIPGPVQLWAAANASPLMLGEQATIFESFLRSVGTRYETIIESSLRYSYTLGETTQQASRRLFGTARNIGSIRNPRRWAETVTRTAMTHMGSVARRETARRNESVVIGYEWVSTLDKRTSEICAFRDGLVWITNEQARETYTDRRFLEGEVYPPAHPNCRSTTSYITKSWEELGIDERDLPEGGRASMNGVVPERTTYYDWLQRQSATTQREVLGRSRYDLLRSGKLTSDQLYTRDGQFLTLSQLRARYNL